MSKKLTMMLVAMCAAMCALASVTISVSAKTVQKSGGGGTITVSGTGAWTAVSDSPWITVKSGASGDGDGKVMFTVGENTTADTRIGHINVNDNVYTITQYGYAATISPTSTTVDRNGGSGTINVTTDAGITWTATANVDWLSVTPTSGRSVGSVTYTVAPYPGVVSRSGSITIAGNTFAVTQTGVDVNIEPATMKIGPDADILMVDTGSREDLQCCLETLRASGCRERVKVAFAGGVQIVEIPELLEFGPDIIGIGREIIDAPLLDMRLDVIGEE